MVVTGTGSNYSESPERTEIGREFNRNVNRAFFYSALVAVAGGVTLVYYSHKSNQQIPITTPVQRYFDAKSTLGDLGNRLQAVNDEDDRNLVYVPEGIRKELEPVFVRPDKKNMLEEATELVKRDIQRMEGKDAIKDYKREVEESENLRNRVRIEGPFTFVASVTVSLLGQLYFVSRRKNRKLDELARRKEAK